jgi:hypothetical protein
MKHLFCSFLFVIGLSLSAFAQVVPDASHYASKITLSSATKHLTILASDEFEGRDTGKPGGLKAAEYIASEFKKMGLIAPVNGSYFQEVPLVETKFDVEKFEINGHNLPAGNGYYMTGAGPKTSLSAKEIVFIGYGISDDKYNDLEKTDISGKVVMLINKDEPQNSNGVSYISGTKSLSDWSTSRNKRIQNILSKNPSLILAVSPDVSSMLDRFQGMFSRGRLMLKENYKDTPTSDIIAHITPETADLLLKDTKTTYNKLVAKINANGKPNTFAFKANLNATYGTKVIDVFSPNVLGYLEGSDLKDELIVVSAHYDHIGIGPNGEIFNGADDDASGTTAVLEIAEAFSQSKKDGNGPRRSILFLAVTGEEKGLLGSDFYTRHPIFPLRNTVTDLHIDMIGRVDPSHEGKPDYVYLIGSDKLSSTLHEISEDVNAKYTKLDLDYKYNDPNDPERIYYRSDHYNFAKNGIPIIFYFNGVHEDYHKATDTIEKIDFNQLVKRTKLVFHTAWEVANRDQRLVVDSNKK